jgi:lipid A disaccharide synthetase
MYVILPFEKDFTRSNTIPCCLVGHPLIDAIHKQADINAADFNQLGENHYCIVTRK